MKRYMILLLALLYIMAALPSVKGQIPSLCADSDSMSRQRCCPNNCGGSRGQCVTIDESQHISNPNNDPRINWPAQYFRQVCQCNEHYGGVDCTSCAYGYYPHPTCNLKKTVERKNLKSFNEDKWNEYRQVLRMARNTNSGYKVLVENGENTQMRSISLYNLFVWTHHFVAKNSNTGTDFAHERVGFLTWHRQMLLWLEWNIQEMLRANSNDKYYEFRLPFWDWTDTNERMAHFTNNRLGETIYDTTDSASLYVVRDNGALFGTDGSNWQTICWEPKDEPNGNSCDPGEFMSTTNTESTGRLKRCPMIQDNEGNNINPCESTFEYWPSASHVRTAVNIQSFDGGRYDRCTIQDSFRNYLEGFIPQTDQCSSEDKMCSNRDETDPSDCNRSRTLHNNIHLILGAGNANMIGALASNQQIGVMAHVAASPNDPIFINHHAMIDCIFEEWMNKTPGASYPTNDDNNDNDVPNDIEFNGHRRDDYIVPFIPVFRHRDMFNPAETFGYSCDLSHIVDSGSVNPPPSENPSASPAPPDDDDFAETLKPTLLLIALTSIGVLTWMA